MTSNLLHHSATDTFGDIISQVRHLVSRGLSALPRFETASRHDTADFAHLPEHLLRDIGIEPHQLADETLRFRDQVDAGGFQPPAFADVQETRATLGQAHAR